MIQYFYVDYSTVNNLIQKGCIGFYSCFMTLSSSFFKVGAQVNRGKDFTRDTVEILATADPGAYVAFAAIPLDLYKRGLNDGLNHWTVST